MKRLSLLMLSVLALALPAWAASEFEGKVDFKVSAEKNEPHEMSYFIKGSKARIEWEAKQNEKGKRPAGAMIIDNDRKQMVMLMPEQKQYMEIPMQEAEDAAQEYSKEDKRQFQKTGRKETILGYASEQFISKDEKGETEIWATRKLGNFSGFHSGRDKALSDWQKKIMKEGFFPLKVHERTTSGKDRSSWEVTKIEKKSLPASMFQPPAGYAKMEMPQMPAGMKDFKSMFRKGGMGGKEN